ncbi:hypothetical protein BD779DRAFT_826025 [Infundibulicybe gibba]|nr:hypothetical protein BD779DRAFT_826025 [Infundibulicybe gibba]
MNDLTEQMNDISHFIETHRTSTSLLKALPSELLVAIFTEYVNIVTDPWIIPAPPEPPLNLMWICSRWREIVLNTPQLWTKISSRTPMANLWVDRSKELPLAQRIYDCVSVVCKSVGIAALLRAVDARSLILKCSLSHRTSSRLSL